MDHKKACTDCKINHIEIDRVFRKLLYKLKITEEKMLKEVK